METSSSQITQLLHAWADGDPAALEALTPYVYDELRRMARVYVAKYGPGRTLQATEVVNEAFVRLVKGKRVPWQDRKHFFAVSAKIMRHVLIDRYRHRRLYQTVMIDEVEIALPELEEDLLALNDALKDLEVLDRQQSQIVELRYFGGLTTEEIAEVLEVSISTVKREWKQAKRWLKAELDGGSEHDA